jgi:hypothetical protein
MIRVLAVIQTLFDLHSWLLPETTGQPIMPAIKRPQNFMKTEQVSCSEELDVFSGGLESLSGV